MPSDPKHNFFPNTIKGVKTAIFRDFGSLLLILSRIYPSLPKWKTIRLKYLQLVPVTWPKTLGKWDKKKLARPALIYKIGDKMSYPI